MKIIEAMKAIKANKEKIADLQGKIAQHCANTSIETPVYGDNTAAKIGEWLQSCDQTSRNNADLLLSIQRTNLATQVAITLGDKVVTKTIAEWVWRRREFAATDLSTWSKLTDRGIKEGSAQTSPGHVTEIKIKRHYDPVLRDKMMALYRSEPHLIDAALEVVNAVTDLVQ